MLKNVNLSYMAQNHSRITILKYLINRCKINMETSLTLNKMIQGDDIHNIYILVSDEHTYLVITCYRVPKLRYRPRQFVLW